MENKKNIIFITISMSGGGTERVIALLADWYINNGFKVSILMIGGNKVEYALDERIDIRSISSATGGKIVERIKRIIKLRKEIIKKKSYVIAMGSVAAIFTLIAAIGTGAYVIISERNDPNQLNHRPIHFYEKIVRNILYIKADKIVFQTEMAKKCFPYKIKKKSKIILNPLRLSIIDNDYVRESRVITAGRLTRQKNHLLLIEAFLEFHKTHPKFSLHIFGKGEMENDLNKYIKENNAEQFIILEGFTDCLNVEFNRSAMYISSSDWEGISNSLAEAIASGVPTIATDCPMGGSATLIDNMVNGILVPVEDKRALIEAMKMIADDKELAEKLSKNGIKLIDRLNIDRIAREWIFGE